MAGKRFANYELSYKFLAKKLNIEGLQLADLVAYPIARHVISAYDTNVMFDLLKPKFPTSIKKGIYGYGLKIFP